MSTIKIKQVKSRIGAPADQKSFPENRFPGNQNRSV